MKNILLAGAAPDTGNLGVNALCDAAVTSLRDIDSELNFGIYDFGEGVRDGVIANGVDVDFVGGKNSKRIYKESSFSNIYLQKRLGLSLTRTARKIKSYDCLLDVGGGDSFTDLYGGRRFELINYPKKIARIDGTPIILLPQTYGPFSSEDNKNIAREILNYSDLVYARDENSYRYLKDMMGSDFDVDKFKVGVDMAFLLESESLGFEDIQSSMIGKDIYGINVSGLIYNNSEAARARYGIKINYGSVLKEFIEKILSEDDGEVWLTPHVHAPLNHYESDLRASLELKKNIIEEYQNRVKVLDANYNQRQVKSMISKMSWFCGTRMHATIASLSSCVPTVNMAYSGKALGVFGAAESADSVLDARHLANEDMLKMLYEHWVQRSNIAEQLTDKVKTVKARAKSQMQEISSVINGV